MFVFWAAFVVGMLCTSAVFSLYLKKCSISFACDTTAATSFFIAPNRRLNDSGLSALRLLRALPAAVLAPVDRSHGFQVRISAACLARRSGVHPFAMLRLQ